MSDERTGIFGLGLIIGAILGAALFGTIVSGVTSYQMTQAWCERIAKSSAPQTFTECLPPTAEVAKPAHDKGEPKP